MRLLESKLLKQMHFVRRLLLLNGDLDRGETAS